MSKFLFNISSFLICIPIAALNFKGFAIYYVLLFISLDIKIFIIIIKAIFRKINNLPILFFFILTIYALILNIILLNFIGLLILTVKLTIFLYLILYFFYGFKLGYGYTGFYIGLIFFIIFQLLQIAEFNYVENSKLLITNFNNWNFVKFNDISLIYTQGNTHTTIAKEGLPFSSIFGNLKSVSSFGAEPSIACFFILLSLFSVNNKILKFFLLISLFFTISKTGFYVLLAIPFIFFSNNILRIKINGFIICFFSLFFLLIISTNHFTNNFDKYLKNCMSYDYNSVNESFQKTKMKSQYSYNDIKLSDKTTLCFFNFTNLSISGRLLPSSIYIFETNMIQKIFGVGYEKASKINIDYVKPWRLNHHIMINRHAGDLNLIGGIPKTPKKLHGGIQVLLLELGFIGFIIYTLLIHFLIKKTNYKMITYVIFLYLITYFYLTIFPFVMFFIAKMIYEQTNK